MKTIPINQNSNGARETFPYGMGTSMLLCFTWSKVSEIYSIEHEYESKPAAIILMP